MTGLINDDDISGLISPSEQRRFSKNTDEYKNEFEESNRIIDI